ncbi:MAG: putative DNA binding domain-containing protein [Dysgonamonadaceae bacterium]|jgi:predicted HTH transcriptional regulator|nr:putative DNA binding domain-containing protein [Dysgonamonadaceae bacterium]
MINFVLSKNLAMQTERLILLVNDLKSQPKENEWIEFKYNFHSPEEIGERISALSNTARIHNQTFGYLVFGIENETHQVLGTDFKAKSHKKGNEELENWLASRLNPRIDFAIYEFDYEEGKHISMFIVPAAKNRPVLFLHQAYIRVGSITRKLIDFEEKERKIWQNTDYQLENEIAKSNLSVSKVIDLLSTQTYFELMKIPYPSNQAGVIEKFISEQLIVKENSSYSITKLGALLFAKNLNDFDDLYRKAVRVIVYKGKGKIETEREQIFTKGYCVGFESMMDWINGQLPASEIIGRALRSNQRAYPEVSIRELTANCIIHQNLEEKGFPMVEIYSDRVAISNPGQPLIVPERFIDEYVSRNEKMADLMRRANLCEEKGSGMDKVISNNEQYHLPPINILVDELRTTVIIYTYQKLSGMSRKDKINACYQHCCLRYMQNEKMTNQSLRERFEVEEKNYSVVSRIIRDAINVGFVKDEDPNNISKKYSRYIPFWG